MANSPIKKGLIAHDIRNAICYSRRIRLIELTRAGVSKDIVEFK